MRYWAPGKWIVKAKVLAYIRDMKSFLAASVVLMAASQAFGFVQQERKLIGEGQIVNSIGNIELSVVDRPEVQIHENAPEFGVFVSVTAESDQAAKSLLSEIFSQEVDVTFHVRIHPEFYNCEINTQNAEIQSVLGGCLTSIRIELPSWMSNVETSLNGVRYP
jgi:hypothetical protein